MKIPLPTSANDLMKQADRNLANLFEFPILFYAACVVIYVSGKVDDFLRHGQKWTKKVKNIQQMLALPNILWAGIMHVCQPVSAFHLVDNMEYFLYLKKFLFRLIQILRSKRVQ